MLWTSNMQNIQAAKGMLHKQIQNKKYSSKYLLNKSNQDHKEITGMLTNFN
jgi:hypothetical protein